MALNIYGKVSSSTCIENIEHYFQVPVEIFSPLTYQPTRLVALRGMMHFTDHDDSHVWIVCFMSVLYVHSLP